MSNPFERVGESQGRRTKAGRPAAPTYEPPSLASASSNPFEATAERQMSSVAKAKDRSAQKRAEKKSKGPSPMDLKRMEAAVLMKMYRAWRRNIREDLIRRHSKEMAQLLRMLRNLHVHSWDEVVDYVRDAKWLLESDETTRLHTLSYIDASMVRSSIRDGRPPIDDPLPGQPDSPFLKIRKMLTGV